jgi:hypothetical protein
MLDNYADEIYKKHFIINEPLYFSENSSVTMVVTSCNRLHLLQRTIDSFISTNNLSINKIIIIDDSGLVSAQDVLECCIPKYLLNQTSFYDIIINEVPLGQIKSIDKAYKEVLTDYILHYEDDWIVTNISGLIKKSIDIINYTKSQDIKLMQVLFLDITESHMCFAKDKLMHTYDNLRFYNITNKNNCEWVGYSFNPNIRSMDLYQSILKGSHYINSTSNNCKMPGLDHLRGVCVESEIGKYLYSLGYKAVVLDDEINMEHIGNNDHVSQELNLYYEQLLNTPSIIDMHDLFYDLLENL